MIIELLVMNFTENYYSNHTPIYSARRYITIINWIKLMQKDNFSIIDIGCGDGRCLELINKKTAISDLTGLEESVEYLKIAKKKHSAKFLKGNVLTLKSDRKYDVVIMSALLHHLIGKNRKNSRELSDIAIKNSLSILKRGGSLIIMEPVFSNIRLMDLLFYIKKILSTFFNRRIPLFGYWNNIGAPVVSYFSKESLSAMITQSGESITKSKYIPAKSNTLYRLLGVKRGDLYLLIQKGLR